MVTTVTRIKQHSGHQNLYRPVWVITDTDGVITLQLELDDDSLLDIATGEVEGSFTEEDHSEVDHTGIEGVGVTSSPLAARVTRNAALNTAAGTITVAWDNEVRDDGGFWDSGDPTKLVVPEDGWYLVGSTIDHPTSSNDYLTGELILDGTTTLQYHESVNATNVTPKAVTFHQLIYCTATQYFTINISAQAVQALSVGSRFNFWICKVG